MGSGILNKWDSLAIPFYMLFKQWVSIAGIDKSSFTAKLRESDGTPYTYTFTSLNTSLPTTMTNMLCAGYNATGNGHFNYVNPKYIRYNNSNKIVFNISVEDYSAYATSASMQFWYIGY